MIDIPSSLVTGAIQGDSAAFEEIYRLSGGFVYSVALRILANSGDAEEVTQEGFYPGHPIPLQAIEPKLCAIKLRFV